MGFKLLTDQVRKKNKNLFDTDHHGVYSLLTIQTILTLHNSYHTAKPANHLPYTQINCESPVRGGNRW